MPLGAGSRHSIRRKVGEPKWLEATQTGHEFGFFDVKPM